jgi:hypothetical protein
MALKFGCDPEFFASYTDHKGGEFLPHDQFVMSPAGLEMWNGMAPVIDDAKHPVYVDKADAITPFRYVMDGVAMELNFRKPFDSVSQFYDSVQQAREYLVTFLKGYGFETCFLPVINFDYHKFWTNELIENERFAQGIIFGCDPDVDAFNLQWPCVIQSAATHPFRYGGGHIHISGDQALEDYPIPAVQMMALTVGNYCIANSIYPELEQERAKYYGKPGKHRVQHYPDGTCGVEYRTPSNTWTSWDEKTFAGLFPWIEKAIHFVKNPRIGKEMLTKYGDDTIRAITTADPGLANAVLVQL